MASVVDICNRGLQKLGAARIQSLSDQSPNARHCNTAFESLRDAELRSHPWNFAIQRFQLAADPAAPAFGPGTACTLPAGWLRVLPPDPALNLINRDWTIEGDRLLTFDTPPINVRCVMQVVDPNQMDPLFREALSSRLAYELCEAITQSNTKKQACAQDYKDAINQAKKTNAIEKVPQDSADDWWIVVRL